MLRYYDSEIENSVKRFSTVVTKTERIKGLGSNLASSEVLSFFCWRQFLPLHILKNSYHLKPSFQIKEGKDRLRSFDWKIFRMLWNLFSQCSSVSWVLFRQWIGVWMMLAYLESVCQRNRMFLRRTETHNLNSRVHTSVRLRNSGEMSCGRASQSLRCFELVELHM